MIRVLSAAALFIPGLAFAGEPLTQAEVDQFVEVAEALDAIDDELDGDIDLDVDLDFDDVFDLADNMFDSDGDLTLTDVLIDAIEDDEEALEAFEDAIKEAGFEDTEAFADVSDRVIAAVIAIEIDESDLEELKEVGELTEKQLRFLPEAVRDLVDIAPKLAAAVEAVPESDIELVEDSGLLD
ncbi:MAG: hypothetical protein HRU11_03795 [Parvularculaceae bacterium]|nr:hypothetical protein [Parvularculaceae bacterium]